MLSRKMYFQFILHDDFEDLQFSKTFLRKKNKELELLLYNRPLQPPARLIMK